MNLSLGVPPPVRGTPHIALAEAAQEKTLGPVPKASEQGPVPLKTLGVFWPSGGPGFFGTSEHFVHLGLLLLPPL